MTSKGAIDVRFYLDGKFFAERAWHVIPNAGEVVMLKETDQPVLKPFMIMGRVFMGEGAAHNRQIVNCYIERDTRVQT